MTEAEFLDKEAKMLEELPPEFRAEVAGLAWSEGHSCGYEEVILVLHDLVDSLLEPIQKFQARIKKEK